LHEHLVNNGYTSEEDFAAPKSGLAAPPNPGTLEAQLLAMEQGAAAAAPRPHQRLLRSSSAAEMRRLLATTVWPDSSNRWPLKVVLTWISKSYQTDKN
jgi:hypothetical protein